MMGLFTFVIFLIAARNVTYGTAGMAPVAHTDKMVLSLSLQLIQTGRQTDTHTNTRTHAGYE